MASAPQYTAPTETPFTAGPDRRSGARSYAVPFIVAVTGTGTSSPTRFRSSVRVSATACSASVTNTEPHHRRDVLARRRRGPSGGGRGAQAWYAAQRRPADAACTLRRGLHGESREQFAQLCDAASEIFELPLLPGSTPRSIVEPGPSRTRQYCQVGVFLSAHCHVLLAIWDGKSSDLLGGTAATIQFHHHDVMPGYTPRVTSSKLNLTEDESDLVYHIVCSRTVRTASRQPGSNRTTRSGSRRTRKTRAQRKSPRVTARYSNTRTSSARGPEQCRLDR